MNPPSWERIRKTLEEVRGRAESLVWWSPSQVARGDDVANDPAKGERAWIVPETTGMFLRDLVRDRRPETVLELGTSIGYSTLWIAGALAEYGGRVHSIDMNPEKHALAAKHLGQAGLLPFAALHTGRIDDLLESPCAMLGTSPVDFLFLDADRGHYHEYFPRIEPFLSDDATVVADNALDMGARMRPFLDLLGQRGWHYEIREIDNGILVAKRPPTGQEARRSS